MNRNENEIKEHKLNEKVLKWTGRIEMNWEIRWDIMEIKWNVSNRSGMNLLSWTELNWNEMKYNELK